MSERLTEKVNEKEYYTIDDSMGAFMSNHAGYLCREFRGKPINKLGQLEDIEEKLGIDLITLFKALNNGVYVRLEEKNDIDFIEQVSMDNIMEYPCFYYCNENTINLGGLIRPSYTDLYFKDYGKTWALTREELERGNKS